MNATLDAQAGELDIINRAREISPHPKVYVPLMGIHPEDPDTAEVDFTHSSGVTVHRFRRARPKP